MNSSNRSSNSSAAAATATAKAMAQVKKDKNKKKGGGGVKNSKAIHLHNIHKELQGLDTDLLLGVITKKLSNTRYEITIPDPSDAYMVDASGKNRIDKPLNKQKTISIQAAALDKKAQRSLHLPGQQAEPGAFVAVCQSGRNFEIQLLLDRDSVRTYKKEGRIHPKLFGDDQEASDSGIVFDYSDDEDTQKAQVQVMVSHKKKIYARGVEVEKPVPLPVKSAKPINLVGGALDAAVVVDRDDDGDVNVDDI